MKCPFEQERMAGTMMCDFMGVPHDPNVKQCPTEIFNACQAGKPVEVTYGDIQASGCYLP